MNIPIQCYHHQLMDPTKHDILHTHFSVSKNTKRKLISTTTTFLYYYYYTALYLHSEKILFSF